MTYPPEEVTATFYLQIRPELNWRGEIVGAKVVNCTQQKPNNQVSGTVLTKMSVKMPSSVFKPLEPAAEITLTDERTSYKPIEVEAEAPDVNDE